MPQETLNPELFAVACLAKTPAWLIPEQAKKATSDLFTDDRAQVIIDALIHLSHEETQADDEPIHLVVLDNYLRESGLYTTWGTPLAEWLTKLAAVPFSNPQQFDIAIRNLISAALHRQVEGFTHQLDEVVLRPDSEIIRYCKAFNQQLEALAVRRQRMFTTNRLHAA